MHGNINATAQVTGNVTLDRAGNILLSAEKTSRTGSAVYSADDPGLHQFSVIIGKWESTSGSPIVRPSIGRRSKNIYRNTRTSL